MFFLKRLLAALALLASFAAAPAMAAGGNAFAASAYDLPRGGHQVELSAFAANPAAYYRSSGAYAKAREIVGWAVGHTLDDNQFRELLSSKRITVAACVSVYGQGVFTSAMYYDDGNARWHDRPCAIGEEIILLDGETPVISLGCLNPIEAPAAAAEVTVVVPPPPAPPSGHHPKPPCGGCNPPPCPCEPPPPCTCGDDTVVTPPDEGTVAAPEDGTGTADINSDLTDPSADNGSSE